MQQELRSQWQFVLTDTEQWLWEVKHPDGSKEQASTPFETLKVCVDDAKLHGWATWKEEERRRVEPGREPLERPHLSR